MGGFVRLYCTTSAADTDKSLIEVVNGKPVYDTMVPALIKTALPNILIGLVVVLVLSASLSTLSSLVLHIKLNSHQRPYKASCKEF